jgi:hypothetical protein
VIAVVLFGSALYAYSHKEHLKGLFGPPAVTLSDVYDEKPGGPTFDHSEFDYLAARFVDEHGMVDYAGLDREAGRLNGYVEAIGRAQFDEMGRKEKLTLLINAYNAFTLRLILDHYPIDSINSIPASERWDAVRWNVAGNIWSLNQIEHEQIRPKFREPRIHFALVCAAVGCPKLRQEAYDSSRLDAQLEDQSQYVHRSERWFRYSHENKIVHLTQLYNWYGGDFEQVGGSILDFAARYSPELKEGLERGERPEVRWLEYDWSLNEQKRKPGAVGD